MSKLQSTPEACQRRLAVMPCGNKILVTPGITSYRTRRLNRGNTNCPAASSITLIWHV